MHRIGKKSCTNIPRQAKSQTKYSISHCQHHAKSEEMAKQYGATGGRGSLHDKFPIFKFRYHITTIDDIYIKISWSNKFGILAAISSPAN